MTARYRAAPVEARAPDDGQAFDPDLGGTWASAREEWRDEEQQWTRAAEESWRHRRALYDLAREWMHRNDTIAALFAWITFVGPVVAVARDYLVLETGSGTVDLRAETAVLSVVERARTGGRRGDAVAETWRARWLEREATATETGVPLALGVLSLGRELTGIPLVGADHVTVTSVDGDVVCPIGAIAYVRVASG